MSKTTVGVFFIALAALLLELNLIRIFDVLWYPNMAYMVITLAVFSFGLAGVYLSIKPLQNVQSLSRTLTVLSIVMAVWVLLMQWAIDRLPFDYTRLAGEQFGEMLINFLLIYTVICVPFLLAGLVLSLVFSHYVKQIRALYFWDLIGAAIGSVMLVPLLPLVGTAGALFVVAGLSLAAGACFVAEYTRRFSALLAAVAVIIALLPFTRDSIDTFTPHMEKRGFKSSLNVGAEGTWWDPISKIDVFDLQEINQQKKKWIAYDGGTQSSYFYPFDGDFQRIREQMPWQARNHFWHVYVLVSHYLKRDTDARVLVIGSAGGQELKAALTYGASEVDAIELVGKVVDLGKTDYADYIGNIMTDSRANVIRGEGRSFLRQSKKTYDIIQMFSNHTSSSIAAGSGSMQSSYLQTVEAYKEYFTHLSGNGVLHINHHVYPKMVATASRAWAELGRGDFRKHVLVAEVDGVRDDLPTMLIKMSPWSKFEVDTVKSFMSRVQAFSFPVDPLRSSGSFLSDDFFSGRLPARLLASVPYRIEEPTDNKPFFNSLRLSLDTLPIQDKSRFVNFGVSELLNSQKSSGYPIDVIHLFVSAFAAFGFAFVFTLGPLLLAKTGREKWVGKSSFVTYFCCLGLGFIILELVFIQIFMKVIGFPLYTYTTVLFTFLFGAGVGSLMSEKMRLIERAKFWVPFLGILCGTVLVFLCKTFLFDSLLELSTVTRILSSIAIIFPLAFFLGMPFPMGVLVIENKPNGTVAWAWALNGLFTVAGGIFCAIFSVYFGFVATMTVAIAAYGLAYLAFRNLYSGYAT